jgi:hypothetical protein
VQITFDVKPIPWPCSDGPGPDCAVCGQAIYDEYSARLPGIDGHVHATTDLPCLDAALQQIQQQLNANA